jgi:nicotinamidase-related amidase
MIASSAALLLIDVVNPLEFEGAEDLYRNVQPVVRRIAALKQRARDAGLPTIYVNDNFDCWHLGFRELIERVRGSGFRGSGLVDLLAPDPEHDHFVLKPLHSGFFRTGLEVLLERLGVETVILTGIAGDICVLFTANDAYMRGYRVVVPADCVASERVADNDHALRQMERLLKADVTPSTTLDLDAFARPPERTSDLHSTGAAEKPICERPEERSA